MGNLEKILEPGERATIRGVLVPMPQYRYYQEQVELNFQNSIDPNDCDCDPNLWTGIFLGIVIGGLTVASLPH